MVRAMSGGECERDGHRQGEHVNSGTIGINNFQAHPCFKFALTSLRSSMDLSTLMRCSLIFATSSIEEIRMEIMIVGDSAASGRSPMCGWRWYPILWNLLSFQLALMSSWRRWTAAYAGG